MNGTHYKNELTKLPVSKPADKYPDGYQAGRYWRKLGGSLYDFYVYEYVGVDPSNGKPLYNKYLTDENGNETEYELLGTCEMKGNTYYALVPADADENAEFLEYVILKLEKEENGDAYLVSIDDDDEADEVEDFFNDYLADEIDYDEENK